MRALSDYKGFLDAHRAKLLVIIAQDDPISRDMEIYCKQTGITVLRVDIPEELRLAGDGHFNPLGNQRLAELVSAWILGLEKDTEKADEWYQKYLEAQLKR